MIAIWEVNPQLLDLYRERAGNPGFLAEPFNACSNAAFAFATVWGTCDLLKKKVSDPVSWVLTLFPLWIASGSFAFHTVPNSWTMWADMIPIAIFQCCMIWEFSRRLLRASRLISAAIMLALLIFCAVLFPNHSILNGSLFYLPNLVLMLVFSGLWSIQRDREPYLLLIGTCLFIFALSARSIDWLGPWTLGTHFLWHIANGAMVYVLLRAIVLLRNDSNTAHISTAP